MAKSRVYVEDPELSNFSTSKIARINKDLLGLQEFPFRTRLSFVPIIKYWEKRKKSEDRGESLLATEIINRLKEAPEFLEPIDKISLLDQQDDLVELLLAGFFPGALRNFQLASANRPYDLQGFYYTPRLRELFNSKDVQFKLGTEWQIAKSLFIARACSQILNEFYDQNIEINPPVIFSISHRDSSLEKFYRAEFNTDYVKIVKLKRLKKISQDQIHQLLRNIYDSERWLKCIPPENFAFEGIASVYLMDVTEEESLSRLKHLLLNKSAIVHDESVKQLEALLRNFFQIESLRLGVAAMEYPFQKKVSQKYKINHNFLATTQDELLDPGFEDSIYEHACSSQNTIIVEDLTQLDEPTTLEVDLLNHRIRSIIVSPLTNSKGQVIGIMEIGSPRANDMNALVLMKLAEVVPLFAIAIERSREEIENKIQAIITEQYTNIHPSVEWKFIETSFHLLDNREKGIASVKPIVFHDVYPLYGQADIVGSSSIRNRAIQADYEENLHRVEKVLKGALQLIDFPLLHQYLLEVGDYVTQIKKGVRSSDETILQDFITREIHPIFDQITHKHPDIKKKVQRYYNQLDHEMETVFQERKKYEDSVMIINDAISSFLEEEDHRAQVMIPHYFEKFKTDGVEYDIYVGQSLLKNEKFSMIHLKNLRLWQLTIMCQITRRVKKLQEGLPYPLETAQLIFVHSNPMSIRFSTEEKRFDVDGAYNIRYEIIKKRIDKATIAGTKERLTKAGKIAIVYAQEKEKEEYEDYLHFLVNEQYIEEEIEDLSIEKLQGVEGLKALRVTVKCDEENGEEVGLDLE
jgi:hypothetical protein